MSSEEPRPEFGDIDIENPSTQNRKPPRQNSIKRVKTALKKTHDDDYENKCQTSIGGRIFFAALWVAVTTLMVIYTIQIVEQYTGQFGNPSNTLSVETLEVIELPQVYVCNWNQVEDNQPCDVCDLELTSCIFIYEESDCIADWKREFFATDNGRFVCYTFNYDKENIVYSKSVAYSGSYSVVFKVNVSAPINDPTANGYRGGLQVTFGNVGGITADDIYKEIRYAAVDLDTYFGFTAVHTIREDLGPDHENYNTTRYETKSSTLALPVTSHDQNTTVGFVGISFSYETLNVQKITYQYSYSMLNLMGDFAGMLGTLMGLDTIKAMAGIPLIWVAIKMRSCRPLEEKYNG